MVSVASAADLPMKAKAPAVQYVKICSLYGAGFYYIPGTDTCLKIGGYLRTQIDVNSNGGGIARGSSGNADEGNQTRTQTHDAVTRVRAVVTFDTRTQGEYGTLRSYYRVGWESTQPSESLAGTEAGRAYWDRAFIQFAGFTVGKAQSFFDIYHHGGARNYLNTRTSGDTGASGLMLWAYTAQFGNGFSASISAEDPIGHNLNGVADVGGAGGGYGGADNAYTVLGTGTPNGMQIPDIVGNLRVDQAWGYVGISAALHQVGGGFFTQNGSPGCLANPNGIFCGHPADTWGYAFGVGGQLNVPGMPGDTVGAMFRYSKGANGYVLGAGANSWFLSDGATRGFAFTRDGFFGNPGAFAGYGGAIQLTEAWGLNAHYEHAWTPALKTSVYGGWVQVNHNATAKRLICGAAGCAAPGGFGNPDFSFWQIGSRTQWAPWKGQLNVGVDVVYTALNSARKGILVAGAGARAGQLQTFGDTDMVTVMFRVQRNWYP
jgi:hypothetical protein